MALSNGLPLGVLGSGSVNQRGHRIGASKMYVTLLSSRSGQDRSKGFSLLLSFPLLTGKVVFSDDEAAVSIPYNTNNQSKYAFLL